jgi:hypothetical protein
MALSAGFTYSCSDSAVGGISDLWLINNTDITSVTEVAGVATAIGLVATKKWYKIGFEDDSCSYTEAVEVSNNRVLYKPEYKFKIGHRRTEARDFLLSLKGCERFVVAHKERATNLNWIVGYDSTQGIRLMSAAQQTGLTIAEENMIEITLGHPTGIQRPSIVTSAVIVV